jgi:hypothetical protein
MTPDKTIRDLRARFKEVKSGVAGDTIFMAAALMFLCEHAVNGQPRKRRAPSKWNKFMAAGMKKGKSLQEVAEDWKRLRA